MKTKSKNYPTLRLETLLCRDYTEFKIKNFGENEKNIKKR